MSGLVRSRSFTTSPIPHSASVGWLYSVRSYLSRFLVCVSTQPPLPSTYLSLSRTVVPRPCIVHIVAGYSLNHPGQQYLVPLISQIVVTIQFWFALCLKNCTQDLKPCPRDALGKPISAASSQLPCKRVAAKMLRCKFQPSLIRSARGVYTCSTVRRGCSRVLRGRDGKDGGVRT